MQFLHAPVHSQRSRIAWGGVLGRNRAAWSQPSQALSFRGNEERGKTNPAEPSGRRVLIIINQSIKVIRQVTDLYRVKVPSLLPDSGRLPGELRYQYTERLGQRSSLPFPSLTLIFQLLNSLGKRCKSSKYISTPHSKRFKDTTCAAILFSVYADALKA